MVGDWQRHTHSHQKTLETDTRRNHRLPALAAFHREDRLNMTDFGTLDTLLNNFTSAISGIWGPQLFFYLQPVLLSIIVLQFGLVAVEATIERDVPLLISHTMIGLLRIGVVWSIFTYGFTWANSIADTGRVLGANISGFGLTPSGVFDNGIAVMQTIFHTKAAGSWFTQLFEDIEFFAVGVAVMLAWAVASIIYLGVLIEAALLVYVAPLVIAFTPLSWTFELLLTWGRSLLGISFKAALILMTLAIGMVLANNWIATFNAASTTFTTNIWNMLIAVVEAILFAVCTSRIPNAISGLAGGAAAMGFGEAVLGMAGSRPRAAYSAGGSSGSGNSGSGNSGGANGGNSGGGGGGSGNGAASGGGRNNRGPQGPTAQELAAKVQTALLKG
jgi:P-type conjugative transfer protein TrbL